MDFSIYIFMFPVAILIATTAMMSGISGAALFMPIFLLVFPLLGSEYVLNDPVTAIAAALLTSTFGFASGFVGYYRKKLIDFKQAKSFIVYSIPMAIIGALVSHQIEPVYIRLVYGILVLGLAFLLFRKTKTDPKHKENSIKPTESREIISKDNHTYQYRLFSARAIPTGIGGFLSGLLSTGIGEVVMPQLVKQGRIPVPIAAATSVLVVILTVISASFTHITALINQGGVEAVPWNLVCYTIPGVIIGGQIGPRLQGRFSSSIMTRGIAIVFIIIGIAMLMTVISK